MAPALPGGYRAFVGDIFDDWSAFEDAHTAESPVSIRINPLKTTPPTHLKPVLWHPRGFYLPERPTFAADPLFHAGAYYPQEAGSMLLYQALQQLPVEKENLRVLDLCGAPGGKSTLILEWLGGLGFLVSNEVIGKRAQVLQENLDKWGHANRMVCSSDPSKFGALGPLFDVVVVDAPCSGEGMFRKEPDAVRMWSPDTVQHCAKRQRRIVEHAWDCLNPGGYLIYSTCTYNREENEKVLRPLMDQHGAESVALDMDPEWNIQASHEHGVHGYRCLPQRTRSEGFFIGLLQKNVPGDAVQKRQKQRQKKTAAPPIGLLSDWLSDAAKHAAFEHNGQVYFVPHDAYPFAVRLAHSVFALSIGTNAGKLVRDELIPSPAMALSIDLNRSGLTQLALEDHEIMLYLQRQSFMTSKDIQGLVLCKADGLSIGWAKVLNQRVKNRWPKEWALRDQLRRMRIVNA